MRVLITGAGGIIGGVLMKSLALHHEVFGIDRKEALGVSVLDMAKNPSGFAEAARGKDAIIHLAWDVKEGGTALKPPLGDNKRMGEILYEEALRLKVPRVIFASSVHASFGFLRYLDGGIEKDHKEKLHRGKRITIEDGFYPLGTYGAGKVYLEALGKAYSARGLQIICVRFGNVTPDNSEGEYPFWLSHKDCAQFVEKALLAELPPFSTFFAVSGNTCNPFDLKSAEVALGYEPEDGSSCPFV